MELVEPFEKPFECFDKKEDAAKIKKGKQYKRRILKLLAEGTKIKGQGNDKRVFHKYYNINQIADALGVSRQLLYTYKLQKDPDIYEALTKIRVGRKMKLIEDMEDSTDHRDRLIAFRLLADKDELSKLNTKHEITGGGKGWAILTKNEHSIKVDPETMKKLPQNLLQGLLEFYEAQEEEAAE